MPPLFEVEGAWRQIAAGRVWQILIYRGDAVSNSLPLEGKVGRRLRRVGRGVPAGHSSSIAIEERGIGGHLFSLLRRQLPLKGEAFWGTPSTPRQISIRQRQYTHEGRRPDPHINPRNPKDFHRHSSFLIPHSSFPPLYASIAAIVSLNRSRISASGMFRYSAHCCSTKVGRVRTLDIRLFKWVW